MMVILIDKNGRWGTQSDSSTTNDFMPLDAYLALDDAAQRAVRRISLPVDARACDLPVQIDAISIAFDSFSDGRGFSLARQLRMSGFQGEIRAFGHIICDQFDLAMRCGFDLIEITETLASRQPEEQWRSAAQARRDFPASYQSRLLKPVAA